MGQRTLHITIGLPGAGKTEWAQEYVEKTKTSHGWRGYSYDCNLLSIDDYRGRWYGDPRKYCVNEIKTRQNFRETILDSFMTNESQIIDILKEILPSTIDTIHIHYWEPNIENCLYNDRGRRDESSETSIKNAIIEKPSIKSLEEKIKSEGLDRWIKEIKMTIHTTSKKPDWKVFYDEVIRTKSTIDKDGFIRSSSWCLGGSWADCWGNHGNVSGETPPETFDVFDSILEEVCPNISFIQYRRLWSECISTEEYSEGDYYGGSTTHAYYRINVKTLYEALESRGLYSISK